MKRLLLLAILIFPLAAGATDYYVSYSTGNDANTGTSWDKAVKSLDKIAALANTAGATAYFRQGDIWSATRINVAGSGTAAAPIVFDVSPGWNPAGALPIISAREYIAGATIVSGTWVDMGGNIWRMGVKDAGTNDLRRLWVDGVEWKRAQTATAPTPDTPWGMDTTNRRLYIYSAGNPATTAPTSSGLLVAGFSQSTAFNCANRDFITARNLELQGGYSQTVQAYGDFCTFENLLVTYSGLNGILIHGVGQDGGNGTTAFGNAYGHIVRNCLVDARDTRRDSFSLEIPNDGIRLNAGAQNCEVYNNQVYNFGHTGIYLTDGQGTAGWPEQTHDNRVYGNIVSASAIDYGRGIATDGGWEQGVPTSTAGGCYNNWIYNNLIYSVPARNQINGTTNYVFNNIIDGVLGVTWRADDTGQGVTFEGYGNGVSYHNVFAHNIVMNCTAAGIAMGIGSGSGEVTSNSIIDNIFYNCGINPKVSTEADKAVLVNNFTSIRGNIFKNNSFYTASSTPIYYRTDGAIDVATFNIKSASGDVIQGNIQSTPRFVADTAAGPLSGYGLGNYRLQSSSPLIDRGIASPVISWATPPYAGTLDLDGKSRFAGKALDIGPYEYQVIQDQNGWDIMVLIRHRGGLGGGSGSSGSTRPQ